MCHKYSFKLKFNLEVLAASGVASQNYIFHAPCCCCFSCCSTHPDASSLFASLENAPCTGACTEDKNVFPAASFSTFSLFTF